MYVNYFQIDNVLALTRKRDRSAETSSDDEAIMKNFDSRVKKPTQRKSKKVSHVDLSSDDDEAVVNSGELSMKNNNQESKNKTQSCCEECRLLQESSRQENLKTIVQVDSASDDEQAL